MDPKAERCMLVDLAVDDHFRRPVELRRIAVRRWERQQDPVVSLHIHATEVQILRHQASHGDGRVRAQELLYGGGQQVWLGDKSLPIARIPGQVPQRGADRAPGGVDSGDQQERHRADDV